MDRLTPEEGVACLAAAFAPVGMEEALCAAAAGRVLDEVISADRDSPPHDVSAMDGYAVRRADLACDTLPVIGEVMIGHPPPPLPPGVALRIVTGACVPEGADTVLRREDVREAAAHIGLTAVARAARHGQHIRRRGENAACGQTVLQPGVLLTGPVAAALSAFGRTRVRVRARVRVGLLTTGNELLCPEQTPRPWQIRDSNGPALHALLTPIPWLRVDEVRCAPDELTALTAALRALLAANDVVLTTGGVSVGQYDYMPQVLSALGARMLFHGLSIRPGAPLLAAVGPAGQAIAALPGNPVSVLVTVTRFAAVALRRRAGLADADPPPAWLDVHLPDEPRTGLTWYRPVRLIAPGRGEVLLSRGSADLVACAASSGFVAHGPNTLGNSLLPYWTWTI